MLDFLVAPVPLWALFLTALVVIILTAAVVRKYGTDWLAILGHLFTIADIRALAVLLWRSNVLPKFVKEVRFGGNEEKFVQYVTSRVLALLPDIQKLDGLQAELVQRGVTERLTLEGRGRFFLAGGAPPGLERQRQDFPLPDKP